jgi:hypothetical protein
MTLGGQSHRHNRVDCQRFLATNCRLALRVPALCSSIGTSMSGPARMQTRSWCIAFSASVWRSSSDPSPTRSLAPGVQFPLGLGRTPGLIQEMETGNGSHEMPTTCGGCCHQVSGVLESPETWRCLMPVVPACSHRSLQMRNQCKSNRYQLSTSAGQRDSDRPVCMSTAIDHANKIANRLARRRQHYLIRLHIS